MLIWSPCPSGWTGWLWLWGSSTAPARLGGRATRDAGRFNRRYRRSGHHWQNRFYSCPLGQSHLWRALLYVGLNPVRAGLLSDATAYPWSSGAAHAASHDDNGMLDSWEWSEVGPQGDWGQVLEARALEAGESASLRAATYRGRPFGDAGFVSVLEARLARNLEPKSRRGRSGPRKETGRPQSPN
jgi:putative transposase